jgi:Nitrogen regulatory protein P-II
MKLVLVLCDTSRSQEIMKLLESHRVAGYTEIPMVLGAGTTGKHMDSRAWPGRGCMLFTLVAREKSGGLIDALREFHERLPEGEGFRIFSIDAEMHL